MTGAARKPRIVAFVPAKGSSERIADKNLQLLDGEHLFKRKLRQLLDCPSIDEIVLDTDSDALAALAADLKVTRLNRPAALASNATDGHELFAYECGAVPPADLYVQCLCTAPFVTADTVARAIRALLETPEADSLVGVSRAKQYLWEGGAPAYGPGRIPNSVDLPAHVIEAMSLYIVRGRDGTPPTRRFGERPILFDLDPTEQIDVNNPADLALAEAVAAGQRAEANLRLRAMRSHLSSPVLSDICAELGLEAVLPPILRPNSPGKLLGRAKTLSLAAVDREQGPADAWKGIYGALDSYRFVRPGDVIMVATECPGRAYFGDLNANLAIRAGAAGVVVDGFTRDTADVRALGLPVYAHGGWCRDIKYEGTLRAMNMPVEMGGIPVANGDMVFADEDGVVVIPAHRWPEIEARAWEVLANEGRIRMHAARGRPVADILAECGAF
ncbi:MAG: NTP transferase domain-containing protein [Sphingomonadaceae bacterium]|nr:NTP transferase domain-containing protein [Sphingomonadaceae bacterium]